GAIFQTSAGVALIIVETIRGVEGDDGGHVALEGETKHAADARSVEHTARVEQQRVDDIMRETMCAVVVTELITIEHGETAAVGAAPDTPARITRQAHGVAR